MEIKWSKLALQKIESIGDYIAEDSKGRALKFITDLVDAVERLKDFPESGAITIENPAFRHVVFKKYRIIYRLRLDHVEIVTVIQPQQELG